MTTAGGADSKINSLLLHDQESSSSSSSHAAGIQRVEEKKRLSVSLRSLEEAAGGSKKLAPQLTQAVFVLRLDTLISAV